MTDKSRKLEDHSAAAKASRGHTPSHQHQITAPTPGFYTIPTDVASMSRHAPPHHHLGPYLPPSYMPHPLTIQGAMPAGAGRAGAAAISNDLGPPIFMPSLNLGTPKPTSKSHKGPSISSGSQVSHDPVSSPGAMSPSELFPHSTIICHAPYSNQSVGGAVKPVYSGVKMTGHAPVNSVRKAKTESGSSGKSVAVMSHVITSRQSEQHASPSLVNAYLPPNNMSSMGISPVSGMSISLVKPSPSTASVSMAELPGSSHMTYVAPTSQFGLMQYGAVPMMGGATKQDVGKSFSKTDPGFEPSPLSKQEGGGVTVMTLATGVAGGATLVCTEGLSPPLPHITTPSTTSVSSSSHGSGPSNEQLRNDRILPPTINHYPSHDVQSDSYSTPIATTTGGPSGGDSIPWPEAMSKTIIIPAPNLTGKDIANLTSSASSSPLPNDKGSNDIQWPTTTPTDLPYLENPSHNYVQDVSSTEGAGQQSPSSQSNHLLDSGACQTGSNVFGISHVIQGSSSPRPSILRKRPLDSRSSDSLLSPSSATSGHTLLSRHSINSPSVKPSVSYNEHNTSLHDNHANQDTFSPRKRPRKQQFESINDGHPPSSNTVNSHKLTSMIAHERLPGPLPLKNKDGGHFSEGKPVKELEKLYVAQLRRPQYSMAHLCKRSHRSAYNHFRRHADIKHHEELPVSLNEVCNNESTWLRSSGWKLQHINSHLEDIEGLENNMLDLMEDVQRSASDILHSLPQGTLNDANHQFVENLILDTKERTQRSLLHIQETRQNMFKVLDSNGKAVEIIKKFSTRLPVSPSISSTSVSLSSQD